MPEAKRYERYILNFTLAYYPNYINMLGKFGERRDGVVWREEGATNFSGQNRDCNTLNNVETITSWQG